MNIYIIEDNSLKATSINDFFNQEFPQIVDISVFNSFQSGLRAIEKNNPDLIILDMTLPTFDRKPNAREGRMRPLGGYDLMYKMVHKSITSNVIVVTQLETFGEGDEEVSFLEITERCQKDFENFFLGSVYFDQGGINWQTALKSLVDSTLNKIYRNEDINN